MDAAKNSLEFESEEYEMNLFGFKLRDIKRENFQFFRKQVEKSIQFISAKFMDLIKDASVDTVENIKRSMKQIEENILKSCESAIHQTVNGEVEKSLNIPDNVILPLDKAHLKPFTDDDINVLGDECDELHTIIIQNGLFLKNLIKELNSYESLQACLEEETQIFLRGQKFLSIQLFDTDLLNHDPTISTEF